MAGDGMTAGRQRSRASNGGAAVGGLRIERVWTTEGVHPYDEVEWERRDVVMTNWRDGSVNFEQRGVEFPDFWSVNAANIVTTKYFRGAVGSPEREQSLKQLVDRVVLTYTKAGKEHGYFATEADADGALAEAEAPSIYPPAAGYAPPDPCYPICSASDFHPLPP